VKKGHAEDRIVSVKTYTATWLGLLFLLAATVAVSKLRLLAQFSVLGSLVIASIKAGLVLAVFMHLKYEGLFLKGVVALALFALTVLIGMTFLDVWYR
jgi:cytochrome c oxidase subunit IV